VSCLCYFFQANKWLIDWLIDCVVTGNDTFAKQHWVEVLHGNRCAKISPSLALVGSSLHCCPRHTYLYRSFMNIVCHIFCGLSCLLLPPPHTQFIAVLAGLPSQYVSSLWPVSISGFSWFQTKLACQLCSWTLCWWDNLSRIFLLQCQWNASKVLRRCLCVASM